MENPMTHICKQITGSLLIITVVLLCGGCVNRLGDFTLISTKNVDFSDASVDIKNGKRVTGDDCRAIVLFFPLGAPSMKEAVDDALEKSESNLLIDQVTYVKSWYIPFIFGQSCYLAEGTAVKVVTQSHDKVPAAVESVPMEPPALQQAPAGSYTSESTPPDVYSSPSSL